MYEMSAFPQENLWVIILDTRNRLIAIERLYQGSLNSSTVRVGEVFRGAIQKNGGRHHHRPQPSQRRPGPQPGGYHPDPVPGRRPAR